MDNCCSFDQASAKGVAFLSRFSENREKALFHANQWAAVNGFNVCSVFFVFFSFGCNAAVLLAWQLHDRYIRSVLIMIINPPALVRNGVQNTCSAVVGARNTQIDKTAGYNKNDKIIHEARLFLRPQCAKWR